MTKGTLEFKYEDDDFSRDYWLLITYEIDGLDYITWDWQLIDVIDWSYDSQRGLSLKFMAEHFDADKVLRDWVSDRLTELQRKRIEKACFADAEENREMADNREIERRVDMARGK